MSSSSMQIEAFFDEATSTVSYIVLDRSTQACAIVDSVLDYDPKAGRTSTQSADRLIARVRELGARLEWILETHVHADHLSAAPHLRAQLGGQLGIGAHIVTVQKVFGSLFNAGDDFARDGRQFDRLFADGDSFTIGSLTARALHTPGHTPACMSYVIEDAVFVGDTLFMPDYGTARCDFPGGDARTLYHSVRRLLSLPPATRLFMCHDYPPGGRAPAWESTVAEQRAHNIHVHDGIAEDDFVAMRTARDATLDMPVLILPSVQVNMRAGHLPEPEANGTRYLKIPLDVL
ncbi:MBL fold metallo-hydrolase [Methyloversatilis sp. XJ19-13]|uniref:MBL fold metallo-hydrolase n=1 Tax=Methyloversatilis sp. XJ19-13 TaxID=2963430 RepID=UPI00211BEC4B|nr:MBL fold metallo-hydrolase [Methyloversatilis sp. XJ19-13]MCQ9372993.1 MBL fold metallo-hydrolase [Methyloversatilis sp. XJ19-13]